MGSATRPDATVHGLTPRSGLYLLDAYGLQNVWVLWRLSRGGLQDDAAPAIHSEDFGSADDAALAARLFHVKHPQPQPRSVRAPRALQGVRRGS